MQCISLFLAAQLAAIARAQLTPCHDYINISANHPDFSVTVNGNKQSLYPCHKLRMRACRSNEVCTWKKRNRATGERPTCQKKPACQGLRKRACGGNELCAWTRRHRATGTRPTCKEKPEYKCGTNSKYGIDWWLCGICVHYSRYQTSGAATLIKANVQCNSNEVYLGLTSNLDACAQKCLNKSACEFVIYGIKGKEGACYWEKTRSEFCEEGWKKDQYNFYSVKKNICVRGLNDLDLFKFSSYHGIDQCKFSPGSAFVKKAGAARATTVHPRDRALREISAVRSGTFIIRFAPIACGLIMLAGFMQLSKVCLHRLAARRSKAANTDAER